MKISKQNTPFPLREEFEQLYAEDVIPHERERIKQACKSLTPDEASELEDRWMNFIEGDNKEDAWNWYLRQINPKNLTDMAKIKTGFCNYNKQRSEKRKALWVQLEPWLIDYFKRNKNHSLNQAKEQCAKHFNTSLSTVKRHTKGFKKPKPLL